MKIFLIIGCILLSLTGCETVEDYAEEAGEEYLKGEDWLGNADGGRIATKDSWMNPVYAEDMGSPNALINPDSGIASPQPIMPAGPGILQSPRNSPNSAKSSYVH